MSRTKFAMIILLLVIFCELLAQEDTSFSLQCSYFEIYNEVSRLSHMLSQRQ